MALFERSTIPPLPCVRVQIWAAKNYGSPLSALDDTEESTSTQDIMADNNDKVCEAS